MVWLWLPLALPLAVGCTTELFYALIGANQQPSPLAISFVQPVTTRNVSSGAPATIQWADLASIPGTSVDVRVERVDPGTRSVISTISLVTARDALADGDSDKFDWDVTGITVGSYQPVVHIAAPDGRNSEVRAPGDFNVTSATPVPTLTFTNPGASDVSVATGGNVNITWTDNGVANTLTQITLRLDPTPADRNSGDEITIAQNIAASDGGTTGTFAFNTNDVNATPVPQNTYTLFAVLVDGVNDNLGQPIQADAVGRIIITP